MPTGADGGGGLESLNRLKSTQPPFYLTPSSELSKSARLASEFLFSSLSPFAVKSPFSHLLTDGFDAEQIWQQIDLQSQPLLSSLRRHVRNFEKNPLEIGKQLNLKNLRGKQEDNENKLRYIQQSEGVERKRDGFDDDDDDDDEEEEEEEEGEDGDGEMGNENGVEDKFLKISELEEYLEKDEAREYGLNKGKKDKHRKRGEAVDKDEDDIDEETDEDEDEDEEELGLMELGGEDGGMMESARYEDFFGRKRSGLEKKSTKYDDTHDMLMDDDLRDQGKQRLSTHEKEKENIRSEIEEMEKANLEPKTWTMQGEVTAAKRPKNSALEVDLDFEHNVRPAPVITEDVTASLEEIIKKRILEAKFDDVQKPPTLLHKAPREKKELDENKSKKGLAEVYEDEYAQKTGLVSTALSFSDEQKKEATMLFKRVCLKLDALSHFHFTPKPVIEDMSIEVNVPALAMEEVAPLAVSDAAMLAPEEIFAGKKDIKEETELTKADRKRRRANKKRKFKVRSTKQMVSKTNKSTSGNEGNKDMIL